MTAANSNRKGTAMKLERDNPRDYERRGGCESSWPTGRSRLWVEFWIPNLFIRGHCIPGSHGSCGSRMSRHVAPKKEGGVFRLGR